MPIIELNELSKWYGEVIGLNNVTAAIGSGITGLLGPNGAGKTTLMGLAMGQLRPSDGSIRVLGERIWDNPAVLSRIGYCPEGDIFWPKLTGLEFVSFLARSSGLRGRAAKTATLRAIEQTGMTESMNRAIRGYSKGMRQRIKISQVLVHEPQLLILDEPFTGCVLEELLEPAIPGVRGGGREAIEQVDDERLDVLAAHMLDDGGHALLHQEGVELAHGVAVSPARAGRLVRRGEGSLEGA